MPKPNEHPADAFMNELADMVAAKLEDRLRARPVLQPRLLTVEQAAIVLGRSAPAVRSMLTSGKLANASPDGRVQIDARDIDVLITNSKK